MALCEARWSDFLMMLRWSSRDAASMAFWRSASENNGSAARSLACAPSRTCAVTAAISVVRSVMVADVMWCVVRVISRRLERRRRGEEV